MRCERGATGRTRALPIRARVKEWRETVERVNMAVLCSVVLFVVVEGVEEEKSRKRQRVGKKKLVTKKKKCEGPMRIIRGLDARCELEMQSPSLLKSQPVLLP